MYLIAVAVRSRVTFISPTRISIRIPGLSPCWPTRAVAESSLS
jgi:hypothetical protein